MYEFQKKNKNNQEESYTKNYQIHSNSLFFKEIYEF